MDRSRWLLLVLALLAILPTAAPAQFVPKDSEASSLAEPVFLPPDRKLARMLETSQELLEQDRYSEAVRALAWVMSADEDYFVRVDDGQAATGGQTFASLKSEARRLLGKLPGPARDAYELQFGAQAKRILGRAIDTGDIEEVADVARRFFHTSAGYEAMILLGRYHMNHGRPLAGALCFDQVYRTPVAPKYEPAISILLATCWQQAGAPEKAEATLIALKKKTPDETIEIGERRVNLFDDDREALDWLIAEIGQRRSLRSLQPFDWVMFRGNASRTAESEGDRPLLLRPRWRQPITFDVETEQVLLTQLNEYADQSVAAIPALQPLALHGMILMRTPQHLSAVDFRSGKLIWQARPLLGEAFAKSTANQRKQQPGDKKEELVSRVWTDKTYGMISSDGEHVFMIEPVKQDVIIDQFGRRRLVSGTPTNILAAYEIRRSQGKRRWSVGGPATTDQEVQDVFFLGAPLPLQGRLYGIAENKGEIQLLVFDSGTGEKLWAQQLAVVPAEWANANKRRSSGISPSFAEGVLVCPTGVGAIVAVDLTTRALLWGYQYPPSTGTTIRSRPWGIARVKLPPVKIGEVWADSCAAISAGRLVVTPAESQQMHCLNLADGSLQWRIDRENLCYLACVHDQNAVVVGRDQVTAIDIVTGKVAENWPLELPERSVPSGRGYHSESSYYLPLNSPDGGEVVELDLSKAQVIARAKSRNGTIPGNLICYRGHVISQNADWLQTYFQLGPLKARVAQALEENADEPWSIVLRGEVLIDEGKPQEAVQLFRRAREIYAATLAEPVSPETEALRTDAVANSQHARELLLEALIETLQADFESGRDLLAEIEQLIETSEEKQTYLRILAQGQEQGGDHLAAMTSYFELIDSGPVGSALLAIDKSHSVRVDRWLNSRLGGLQKKLGKEESELFQSKIVERRTKALASKSVSDLRTFLGYFGAHPSALEVTRELARRLKGTGNDLEYSTLLLRLAESTDQQQRRTAVAALASFYDKQKHHQEAARYFAQLRDRWTDEICENGKTGRELFEALPPGSPVRQILARTGFPYGVVKKSTGATSPMRRVSYQPATRLKLLSHTRSLSENARILVDQRQNYSVIGEDDFGRRRWQLSLAALIDRRDRQGLMYNQSLLAGRMDGSLLILSAANQVVAIDTLKAKEGSDGSEIIWKFSTAQYVGRAPASVTRSQGGLGGPPPWGDNAERQYQAPQILARLGPITPGGVTFPRNRELVSVDPLTGEVLWVRKGVPQGAHVFGDDQYVLVLAPDAREVDVYSAMDGTLLGRRKVPSARSRWKIIGRKMLIWRTVSNKTSARELALFDPWSQSEDWVHPIERGTKGYIDKDETVSLLQRDGSFMMLDLKTGEKLVEQVLMPEPALKGIYVIRSGEVDMLITNRGGEYTSDGKSFQPMPLGHASAFITGRVYAFDHRTGSPLWQIPATVKQYGLVLNQPADLPCLVFARRISAPRNKYSMSFLFVDKRSGRLLFPEDTVGNRQYNFEVSSDPVKKTVTLHFQNQASNVVLKYTDQPVPPGPPVQAEGVRVLRKSGSTLNATIEALRKAAQGLRGLPVQKDREDDLFGED